MFMCSCTPAEYMQSNCCTWHTIVNLHVHTFPSNTQSTLRSIVGSLRFSLDSKEEGLHRTYSASGKKQSDSDSSYYGTFGLVEIQPDKLDCFEKIGMVIIKQQIIQQAKFFAVTVHGILKSRTLVSLKV